MTRIVILTALELKERQFVVAHLKESKITTHPETGTDYFQGVYNDFEIFVGKTDQTNVNASLQTERAISFLKPDLLFFVGVAGGIKDVSLGDVVIGEDVFGYERGKSIAEKGVENFLSRPKFGSSSYKLIRHAIDYSLSNDWNISKSKLKRSNVNVFSGTIASGEKVVASSTSEAFLFIKKNASHALAIEMEGLGFLEAANQYPYIPSLLLRGISDLVDNKEQSDASGSQEQAMVNLTAFLFGFLNSYGKEILEYSSSRTKYFEKYSLNEQNSKSIIDALSEVMHKLYPEGVKTNRVWQRAGGDISLIALNNNGYTQWLDALELLENGGGGDISVESLIKIMQGDFKNNPYVQNLKKK